MKYPRLTDYIIPIILFVVALFLSQSGLFNYPDAEATGAEMDKLFYYLVNSILWMSIAFLINTLLRVFVWRSLIKIKSGNIIGRTIQDFITVLIYIAAIGIIIVNVFFVEFNATTLYLLVLMLFLGTIFHPKIVSLLSSKYLASEHPYNIGDWIEVFSKNGKSVVTGEIYDISRKGTRLKTESNSLVLIPNQLIESEYVIKNYWATNKKVEFEVDFCIDFSVPIERAKRILMAGAKQAILEKGLLKIPEPKVYVQNTNSDGIIYSIKFWIVPWEDISPREATDIIISIVMDHLHKSGIQLSYKKHDVYTAPMPKRNTSIYSSEDRISILAEIELFDVFNNEELEQLSKSLKVVKTEKGKEIINQSEHGDSMFILVEGLLNVFVNTAQGNKVQVAQLHPGQFFGEVSLLTGEQRSATVTASTETLIFEITKQNIQPIFEKRTEIIESIGKLISERHELNVAKLKEHEQGSRKKSEIVIKKIKEFFGIHK